MATGRAVILYPDAIKYRINGGSPQMMTYKKKSQEKYECVGATERTGIPGWFEKRIENVRDVEWIEAYSTRSMAAYDMWRLELKVSGFKPIVLGNIDCTQKSIEAAVPTFFKQCKRGTFAVLKAHAVHPELVYQSAGLEFESFMDKVQDQWRVNIMKFVKEGIKGKHLDENQKINPMQFQQVIGCLSQQCKSKELGIQFGTALKQLKL